jgi:hypothetical protein
MLINIAYSGCLFSSGQCGQATLRLFCILGKEKQIIGILITTCILKEKTPYSSLVLQILTKISEKQENSSLLMNSLL